MAITGDENGNITGTTAPLPVQPVHIDLTPEKQQWMQAVYGKEVRQSTVDAYTKIEVQLNTTVDQLVDSINAANATTQASADAVSAANSALSRAHDAVGASAQALQSAENAVRISEEALNEAGTTLTAAETFARSAEEDAESAKTDADRAKEEADRAAQFTNLAGTNIQVIEIGQDMETIDLNEYTVPGFYKVNSIEGRVTVNNAPVNIGYATGFAMIVTEAGMDMMSDVFTKYVQIIICSNVMYVREKNTQQFGVWTSWTELTGGTPVDPAPAAVTPSVDWLDGKTLVIDGNKIRADQPYINAPTATTSWKLSSHAKPGVYAFKILAGVSTPPQDAPGWFTGRTDFCLEVVPFNGDGTNGKGIVLQRFSGKEYKDGITQIRESIRLIDVGAVENGADPEEWTDLGAYKTTMLASESVGKNPQTAVVNLSLKSEEYSIAKGSSGLPTEDDYIVLTAGGETNSTGAQILVREKDGMLYTRGRYGGGWKGWKSIGKHTFKGTNGITGNQYIPVGSIEYSAPGSGYVFSLHMDINVYGRLEDGASYGISKVSVSITSHNGTLTFRGFVDNKTYAFNILAYLSDDQSKYNLYIVTSYGGVNGEMMCYTNAEDRVFINISDGISDIPAGIMSGSFGASVSSGDIEVIGSIRDVDVLYSGTASVDGGAVTLTDSLAGYKMLSFACFNGQDRHTGTLMCDTLETGVQYVVPVGSGYIKFSFAGDQFTLISNTVGANLHRIYGKK